MTQEQTIDIFDADQCTTALGKKLRQQTLPLDSKDEVKNSNNFAMVSDYLKETLEFIDAQLPQN